MKRRKSSSKSDVIANKVIRWYRVHGNDCEFSVWKLIRLVNGYHSIVKIDKSELELARYYASKVTYDLTKWRKVNERI